MATKNPRLTITLKPELSAHFRRLSELTGQSQSSIISELLAGSESVLERMVRVLEAAEAAKGAIRGRVARGLDDAQQQLEGVLGIACGGFDSVLKDLEAVAKTGGAGGASTPLSNRGVRNSSRPSKSKEKLSTYATSDLEKVTGVKTPKKTVSKRAVKGPKNGEI